MEIYLKKKEESTCKCTILIRPNGCIVFFCTFMYIGQSLNVRFYNTEFLPGWRFVQRAMASPSVATNNQITTPPP